MEASIAAMWAAVTWITRNEARVNLALASQAHDQGRAVDDDAAADRLAVLRHLADFLAKIAPHETAVRALADNGLVHDFPMFSSDTSDLQPGDIGLMRIKIEETDLEECRVRVEATRISHSIPTYRAAIVGRERPGGNPLLTPPR